jgi:hypothetical protein
VEKQSHKRDSYSDDHERSQKAKTDYSFQLFATNPPNNPYNLNVSDVKVPSNSLYSKSKYRESICIKSDECKLDPLLSNLGSGGVIEDRLSYDIRFI